LPDPLRKVLVTRPQPGATETARRLAARGYTPIIAPVLTIVPRTLRLPAAAQAILATSANAVQPGLPDLPFLAVGDATAARARDAGPTKVRSAGRDAAALATLACAICDPAGLPLLLLSGAGQGQTLAKALRSAGFRVHRRIAYAAHPIPALPEAAFAALRAGPMHALFFSPETARVFVSLVFRAAAADAVKMATALAISEATRTALAPLPWQHIHVASTPNQDALLALLP
jgi:uroporphyrinogen-III synthase